MSKVVLRLITKADLADDKAIERLKEWRIKNRSAYVGNYKITYESIKKWLKKHVLDNPNRTLFWVMVGKDYIGHVGIKNSIEIDNVSRGVGKHKGAMHEALEVLLDMYSGNEIWLQVKPDNKHAIAFYEKNGFKVTGKEGPYITMFYEN